MSLTRPLGASQDTTYVKIPNAIASLELTPREEQLVGRLLSHRWTPGALMYPSIKRLAEQMNCTRRTVQRTLRRLEARGLIVSEPNYGPVTGQTSNTYHLAGALLAIVTAACDQVTARPVDDRRPPVSSPAPKEHSGKNSKPNSSRQGSYTHANTRAEAFTSGRLGAWVRT